MTSDLFVGGAIVLLSIVGLIRFLFADTRVAATHRQEIADLRADVAGLKEKVVVIEALYDEERREKHRVINELTKAQVLLGIIIDLAEKCTCGALDLVHDLLARAVPAEHQLRRVTDLTPEET